MQIRPEDQPDDTTGRGPTAKRRGSSPTEPITTRPTETIRRGSGPDAGDSGAGGASAAAGAPTEPIAGFPTEPMRRAEPEPAGGPDYSNWWESDLYRADDDGDADTRGSEDTATRPIDRGRLGDGDNDATRLIDRTGMGDGDDERTQAIGAHTEALDRPYDRTEADADEDRYRQDDHRPDTAPQPISSERAAWDIDGTDMDDRVADDRDIDGRDIDGVPNRAARDGRPQRTGIAAKLGLLLLGLVLAVVAAVLLGTNGPDAAGAVRSGQGLDGAGLLAVLGFAAGVVCLAVIVICGRISSTAPLMGSIIAVPALFGVFSGSAASWLLGQLSSWGIPSSLAGAFLRPETALAGVLLFLIGLAFSARRRAEHLAGPVSSFFLGVFSAILVLPGLALVCLSTQEDLLRAVTRYGVPGADITRPLTLVLGLVLVAIGVASVSRAPGGMVVSGVLVLVVALAAGYVYLAGPSALPAAVSDPVQQYVTATAPLLAALTGVVLLVASFAGLGLRRDTAPVDRY